LVLLDIKQVLRQHYGDLWNKDKNEIDLVADKPGLKPTTNLTTSLIDI